MGKKFIRKTVKKKVKADINKMNPIDYVSKCHQPVLFVVGASDDLVKPHHSESLLNKYGSKYKELIKVEGDHNSERP